MRVRIDPYAHVKLSTLEDSEHSSAIMDGCVALLPTRQLFTHGLLSRLASLQLLLLGHRTLRTQACQPMSARPSEAKRGREQKERSASHLVVVLIFILLALGLLIHDGLLGLVGATTRAGRLRNTSAESRPSVSGGRKHGNGRQRLPSPVESTQAQSPITFLIKGATQGERAAPRAQRSAARGR